MLWDVAQFMHPSVLRSEGPTLNGFLGIYRRQILRSQAGLPNRRRRYRAVCVVRYRFGNNQENRKDR